RAATSTAAAGLRGGAAEGSWRSASAGKGRRHERSMSSSSTSRRLDERAAIAARPASAALATQRENPSAPRAARSVDVDLIADLAAEQRTADRGIGRHASDARDLHLHALAVLVLDLDARADADRLVGGGNVLVHDHRAVEPIAQHPDAALKQTLLVLRRVILEVLREIAEAAGRRDRLHGLGTPRSLELRELCLELLLLRLRQRLGLVTRHRSRLARSPLRGVRVA